MNPYSPRPEEVITILIFFLSEKLIQQSRFRVKKMLENI